MVVVLASGCGAGGAGPTPPPATFETFTLTLEEPDAGVELRALDRVSDYSVDLPLADDRSQRTARWSGVARSIERIGVIRLQVVATFGALEARSAPFTVEITHMVNRVDLEYRDSGGVRRRPVGDTRFDTVQDVVLTAHGTNLAGRTVSVTGAAPFVAPAGDFEMIRVPALGDFAEGRGVHQFSYEASAGGTSRGATISLRRWKLESCGWTMEDGTPASGDVALGAKVVMRADGWGFPDTSGFLVFKRDQAEFKLWERDDGQNTTNVPQPLINNDDEVDFFKVDVMSSVALQPWTTVFDEEVPILNLARAEYYFEVKLQDERCTSGEISVPER